VTARILARPPGPDGGVVVVHVDVDCCDAMGANLVNTLCERLAEPAAHIASAKVGLRILSNLSDRRTVRVTCRAPDAALADERCPGPAVRAGIAAASRFAELDSYRAVTHNKGVMNGVDAVLVATAQDWRAVEAGAHAFAARSGAYRPLAVWREDGDGLVGELEIPLAVGTVGGALHVHRGARLALRLAGIDAAPRLAALAAAAGLACNLAALRALATDGIQHGHMALHARAVARAAGAPAELVDDVADALSAAGDVRIEAARVILQSLSAKDSP
jgi:hydroxymethylglutaryl-CoA reductase